MSNELLWDMGFWMNYPGTLPTTDVKVLNSTRRSGYTPLYCAVSYARTIQPVVDLVEAGADVNVLSEHGDSVLSAVRDGHLGREILQYLVGKGVYVNNRNALGSTVLHQMCSHSEDPVLVEMLLRAGADVHATSKAGMTPLHRAVSRHSADEHLVHLLVRYGADVNAVGPWVWSPLYYAVCEENAIGAIFALLEHGAIIRPPLNL